MRWLPALGTLVAGCFNPTPPEGAPCATTAECPSPLQCFDGACLSSPRDAPREAGDLPDDATDAAVPPAHIQVTPGWSVSVYRDFSAAHTYDEDDWIEDTEVHSNAPKQLLVLHPPFPQLLGLIAGRQLILLSPTGYEVHDYGQHPRNTEGLLDHFSGIVWSDAGGAPALVATSSSEDGGDGLFSIDPAWALTKLENRNNSRCVTYDPAGSFDGRGIPTLYYGAQYAIFVPTEDSVTSASDPYAVRVSGTSMLYVNRPASGTSELVQMASTTHDKTVLATKTWMTIAEGDPEPPGLAYVILDGVLARVDAGPTFQTIGSSTDPEFVWRSAATPPPGHPLASGGRSIYVLESNRTLDIDRVLRFTQD